MYNKRQFNKINDKKVLHKIKKQWVTISLSLLMMIGGVAVATHVSANASQLEKAPMTYVQNKNDSKRSQNKSVTNRAKHMHTSLLNKATHNKQTIQNKGNVNKNTTNISHQINTTHSGNEVTVNNKPIKYVSNVNKLKANQSGIFKKQVYNRFTLPFNKVLINHSTRLHRTITLSDTRNYGHLRRDNIVRISKAFRDYGHYGNYLRYEIPLRNKRSAFITGDFHNISYVAPTTNYRYYQRKINHILNHSHNKRFNRIRKSISKLAKRENRNYRKYMGLYVETYNIQQNLRHPVIVNYNNKLKHNHKNIVQNSNSTVPSNLASSSNNDNNDISSSSINMNSNIASSANDIIPNINSVVPINPMPTPTPNSTNNSASTSASASASKSASISNSVSASNSVKNASYAQSAAKSADSSIANSYKNSVSASVSVANKSKASSAASSADNSIEDSINNSIANSYAKSTENTSAYKNSVSAANSKTANSAAQSADNSINNSIANSAKNSADSKIAQSVSASVSSANHDNAESAASSANSSIANSYKNSVSNSVSSLDKSIAQSAASSADASIANSESAMAPIYANIYQAKQQTLKDINDERQQNGRAPLVESPILDKLSTIRANQVTTDFNHYNSKGQFYGTLDAPKVGLPSSFDCAENIAENYGSDGAIAANNANSDMMYHDQDQGNGHRDNILDPTSNYVGIGVAYKNDGYFSYYYIAEDFIGNDELPDISSDKQSIQDIQQQISSDKQEVQSESLQSDQDKISDIEEDLENAKGNLQSDESDGSTSQIIQKDKQTIQKDQNDLKSQSNKLKADKNSPSMQNIINNNSNVKNDQQQLNQAEQKLQADNEYINKIKNG